MLYFSCCIFRILLKELHSMQQLLLISVLHIFGQTLNICFLSWATWTDSLPCDFLCLFRNYLLSFVPVSVTGLCITFPRPLMALVLPSLPPSGFPPSSFPYKAVSRACISISSSFLLSVRLVLICRPPQESRVTRRPPV